MLRLKDLQNRVYSGKQCVRFEVPVQVADNKYVLAQFTKIVQDDTANSNEWRMRVVLDRTRDKDSEVYSFGYVMPRNNLPLELIAATGLRYFQMYLKEEVQSKTNMDFYLGSILEGM